MNKYDELVVKMAKTDRTIEQRSQILVKELAQMICKIMEYNYICSTYKGNGTGKVDKLNEIKAVATLVKSDFDVYLEALGIADDVETKSIKRFEKLVDKLVPDKPE